MTLYSKKARLRSKWERQRNQKRQEIDQYIEDGLRKAKAAAGWKRMTAGSLEDLRAEVEMLKNLRADIQSTYSSRDRARAIRRINSRIESKVARIAKIEMGVIEGLNTPAGEWIDRNQRNLSELAGKVQEAQRRLNYAE